MAQAMLELPEPCLRERTTIRLGGPAIAEITLQDREDFARLPERLKFWGGRPLCLGRGSNILASDGKLPVVLVRIGLGGIIKIVADQKLEPGKVAVYASADTPLAKLLNFCLRNGLSGLEGLCGIPGSVGGAVAMNAGSFGCEISSVLQRICVVANGVESSLPKDKLSIKYRDLDFQGKNGGAIVSGAIFTLTTLAKNVIYRGLRLNFINKKSRQPLESWSAGCAFKNPAQYSAGKLLDLAGFRGRRLGGMAFSARHANFLINEGNGSAQAAFDLLRQAEAEVFRLFGIKLEPEVKIVAEDL